MVLPITEESLLRLATTSGVISVSIVFIRSVTDYVRERQRLRAFLAVSGRSGGDLVKYVEGQCEITSGSSASSVTEPPSSTEPSHNGHGDRRQDGRRDRRQQGRRRTDPPPRVGPGP